MSQRFHLFFCTCPNGLETALTEEITELACYSPTLKVESTVPGGVHCSGKLEDSYVLNLHSRIASRVLLRIAQTPYKNENDLYDLTLMQSWENWFGVQNTIRVDVTALKSPLHSIEFAVLKIKDAICDRFREQCGKRPYVDTRIPDIRIAGFLNPSHFTLYLDTSGEALFKRGWRQETGDAPLRENLAAGLLRIAGWKPGDVLFDPMCGAGTILIEAAQMLAGIPAGSNRAFAFEKFIGFNSHNWQKIKEKIPKPSALTPPSIFGSDVSGDAVVMTRQNLQSAGITFDVPLKQIDAQEIKAPAPAGLILTNPPYGERLEMRGSQTIAADDITCAFYGAFSSTLKQRFAGWRVCIFTADLALPKLLRLKESRKTPLFNGALECRLFRFEMVEGYHRREAAKPKASD